MPPLLRLIKDTAFVRYISQNPFSVMALGNIIGDLGYLGFAYDAGYGISLPKFAGAVFTIAAHIILLAHGDRDANQITHEGSAVERLIAKLRSVAKNIVRCLPDSLQIKIKRKPVGIAFMMLAMNGVGLLVDASLKLRLQFSVTMTIQLTLALLVLAGCLAFALADFVRVQKTTNYLLKAAPAILTVANLVGLLLCIATLNPFIILSLFAYYTATFAAFFTKIDKSLT